MTRQLSESLEDYLEAIAELIAVDGHAHSKEIAGCLNVKMPSVTGALRQLEEMGYIVYNTHYPVQLTPAGKKIAERVIHRHRILKKFFAEILGLPAPKASETACRLEHIVDEDSIQRVLIFSEAIENRSDAKSLQTYLMEAMDHLGREDSEKLCVLSALAPDEPGIVERYGRNLNECPRPLPPVGEKLTVSGISLDKTMFRITVQGREFEIPASDAENIWVKRLSPPVCRCLSGKAGAEHHHH